MLTSVSPKLPYIDKSVTKEFYTEGLAFELVSEYPEYLILKRDKIELHFFPYPSLKPDKSDFMIYVRLSEGIEDFYKEIQQRGVRIHPNGAMETKPWNQKEFSILDPNGTLLTFGQAVIPA